MFYFVSSLFWYSAEYQNKNTTFSNYINSRFNLEFLFYYSPAKTLFATIDHKGLAGLENVGLGELCEIAIFISTNFTSYLLHKT